jgi:uncharacterized Zn-finger protein
LCCANGYHPAPSPVNGRSLGRRGKRVAFTAAVRHATIALRVGLPARPGARMPLRVEQMQPFETIYIDSMVAACNGGGGPLGHPKVYLNLAGNGQVECPYCSRLFVNRAQQEHGI